MISLTLLVTVGCSPTPPAVLPTQTPLIPTATPTSAFPSATPRPSATPIASLSPTPDLLANLGEVLFQDDFSGNQGWDLGQDTQGGTNISAQQLTIAVNGSGTSRLALSPFRPPSDSYIEVSTVSELCAPQDEYGLAVRINNANEQYRWTLNCFGEVRALKVLSSGVSLLAPVAPSAFAIPGPFGTNRLGIRMQGNDLRFYLNGHQVLAIRDGSLQSGRFGLYVRSTSESQTTVEFDDLSVRSLPSAPSLTPSPPD